MNWFELARDRWPEAVRLMREIRRYILRNSLGEIDMRRILALRLEAQR